jgi:hypothetical protein
MIAEQGMDRTKLARKWKAKDRLIQLIVTSVKSRAQKGDAFRGGTAPSGRDSGDRAGPTEGQSIRHLYEMLCPQQISLSPADRPDSLPDCRPIKCSVPVDQICKLHRASAASKGFCSPLKTFAVAL